MIIQYSEIGLGGGLTKHFALYLIVDTILVMLYLCYLDYMFKEKQRFQSIKALSIILCICSYLVGL